MDANRKYLFNQGTYYKAYESFGCHVIDDGAKFRVWAPAAAAVYVTGSFDGWQFFYPLFFDGGVWEGFLSGVAEGCEYKFFISRKEHSCLLKEFDGKPTEKSAGAERLAYKITLRIPADKIDKSDGVYKSDPFAFYSQTHTQTNSIAFDLSKIKWSDGDYLNKRSQKNIYSMPVNIYEAHIGSWKKGLNYREFGDRAAAYLKKMGYTHIELMGVAEYPLDDSWGYQVTGFFAPTSRYGSPQDFAYMIDVFHRNNIGVIIDWVAAHFPKNENGLIEFDGGCLFEPTDPIMREHLEWGTRCFDYSRPQVKSFLISNAVMWLDVYHIDGLRVDAVASMLYLDYGRDKFIPNHSGGRENLFAIEFLKQLNTAVFGFYPDVIMAAEESTAFPSVTAPVHEGGLGFNFKWNMGWMNDALKYISLDPLFKGGAHNLLTFSFFYAFSENFILPLSHDEVVYGKRSMLNKMFGQYEDKFALLRSFMMYVFAHPGKKLSFMGSEFAQFDEWDYKKELCWFLLDYPLHKDAQEFIRTLNNIYLKAPALFNDERSWNGFCWRVADDKEKNVIVFERKSNNGDRLLTIINFSPINYKNYRFGLDRGTFKQLLKTDKNGWQAQAKQPYKTEKKEYSGHRYSMVIDVEPFAAMYLYKRKAPPKQNKKESLQKK